MRNWSTFGAWTNHRQTRTHKTYHGPNFGTPPPSPYSSCLATRLAPKCHFFLGLPTSKILEIRTFTTLEAHKFLCGPLIEMKFETKFYPSLRTSQQYVVHHLHISKSRRFLIFNGQESNCHFDSQLFF